MKLKVISNYRSQHTEYLTGSVIDVDPVAGEFLMRDAPGCFRPVDSVVEELEAEELGKELDSPPVDKMIRRGKRTK